MWLYYMVAFTILPLLESYPQVHSPFVQSCRFFSITSHHWPACNAVLRGLKAVSQQTCTPLPAACELYLAGAAVEGKVDDFPLTWRIIEEEQINEILWDEQQDSEPLGTELGQLISKWSAQSLAV
jgi:hypothetical protein